MFKKTSKKKSQETHPVLFLRDIVIFPGMIAPLFVGRDKSVASLEKALDGNRKIMLITQRDSTQDNPEFGDVFHTGVVCTILQLLRLPDGTVKALVEGGQRAVIDEISEVDAHLQADITF